MAVIKPEWATEYHAVVREYFLTNNHTQEDLEDWEFRADKTARAMPVSRMSRGLDVVLKQRWPS